VTARRSLLLAAALLAACNKTSTRPSIRLNGPSAVAVFHGKTLRDPDNLRAYLAVANLRGDDLRLLDAVDGKAVVAPGLIMSLSVPTLPRPALLAAGALPPDTGGVAQADLLVLAPTGLAACTPAFPTRLNGCIQVFTTWDKDTAVDHDQSIDLFDLLPVGDVAEVLSLAVVPVPAFDGTNWSAAPDKARVLAGLSAGSNGGRLLVADFARAPDGAAIVKTGAAVHDLGFEAVSLSLAPDLIHLYAASPDPVGQVGGVDVEGVAELDLSGPFDGVIPPARPMDAHAPTTAVLAARVQPFKALTSDPAVDEFDPAVDRVYAALEPTRCGRDQAVACGLVTFDAVAGTLIPDPAIPPQLPFAAPIAVPGHILGLIRVDPPTVGSGTRQPDGTVTVDGTPGPLQQLVTQTVTRWTSTLAVATSSLGPAYLLDLARGGQARDASVLPLARVSSAASIQGASGAPYLALFDENAVPPEPALTRDPSLMPARIGLTPGFSTTDSWSLGWQAVIPGLADLQAQVQPSADGLGLDWLAAQYAVGGDVRGTVRIYDPQLGLQVGDLALVTPEDAARCPVGFELVITDFLHPGTGPYPGGAVRVAPSTHQPAGGNPGCLNGAPLSKVRVTFVSKELLLLGNAFGYAGRPTLQAAATDLGWALEWKDPGPLACPLLDTAAWPPAICDLDCRELLLSRRSRRTFYVTEQCASTDTACTKRWGLALLDNVNGPVLKLKVGLLSSTGDELDPVTTQPARGATLTFTTVSGQVMSSRQPQVGATVTGMALPSGMATFDRAGATGSAADGVRVFVSYPSNEVLDCSPSVAAGSSGLIR
jgi:hypothetical protein